VWDTSIVLFKGLLHVEIISGLGVYPFGKAGRCYGILIGIRGRAYVIAAIERGILYRFGATIHSPAAGRFDSCFALRAKVGGIDLVFKNWLRNEVLPIYFRSNWIRGYIDISRHGLYTFQLFATDRELHPRVERKDFEISLRSEDENISADDERRERLVGDKDW
jgi:hypothetical protein